MSNENIQTAKDFEIWKMSLGERNDWDGETRKEFERVFKALPTPEKYALHRGKIGNYFAPENRSEESSEEISPSGKWKLVITSYATRKGSWSYILGEVYNISTGEKILEVKRNYCSMWFEWFENHSVTGEDYLLTGEDYQGYTVCNLSKGTLRSHIPDAAFFGHGWCPASAELMVDGRTLLMSGCYWACPYEKRLWDFSNPDAPDLEEKGLPCLTSELWIDDEEDGKYEFLPDGTFCITEYVMKFKATGEYESDIQYKKTKILERQYRAEKFGDAEAMAKAKEELEEHSATYQRSDDEEDAALWEQEPYRKMTYIRKNLDSGDKGNYVLSEEWDSPLYLKKEADRKERDRKYHEEYGKYRSSDPFCAKLSKIFEGDNTPRFSRIDHSLQSKWDGDTNAFYFRVRVTESEGKRSARLIWGSNYGPLKVEVHLRGEGYHNTEFPRTMEGFDEAFALAQGES